MAERRDARGRFLAKPVVPDNLTEPSTEGPAGPSDTFLTELQTSWTRYGAATIEQVRCERPHDYLRLMASSLAKQGDERRDAIGTMSDDEVADELRRILGQLAPPGIETGA